MKLDKKEQIEKCITNIKSNMEKIMKLADLDYITSNIMNDTFHFTTTKTSNDNEYISCHYRKEDKQWYYGKNYNKLFENIKEN